MKNNAIVVSFVKRLPSHFKMNDSQHGVSQCLWYKLTMFIDWLFVQLVKNQPSYLWVPSHSTFIFHMLGIQGQVYLSHMNTYRTSRKTCVHQSRINSSGTSSAFSWIHLPSENRFRVLYCQVQVCPSHYKKRRSSIEENLCRFSRATVIRMTRKWHK